MPTAADSAWVLTIHASKLDSFVDCPLRGMAESVPEMFTEFGYEIRKTPQYITGQIGSSIHAGVANLLEQKKSGIPSEDVSRSTAMSIARNELLRLMDKEPGAIFTKKFSSMDVINQHIDEYVAAYAEQVLPMRFPKLIEYGFEGKLADDVLYKTTLDLYDENDSLFDLKSGAQVTSAMHQMGLYLLLLKQQGYEPKGCTLDYMLRSSPQSMTGPITHTPIIYDHIACINMTKTALKYLIMDFRKFAETKKLDHILRNPRSSMCNQFCPLFKTTTCNAWKGAGV